MKANTVCIHGTNKKKDATGSKFIPKGVAAWEGFPALGWSPILVGFYIAVWV